jgi:two-component system, NarL family, response regulator NreC
MPRILIVDDSAAVRRGLRNLLQRKPAWAVCGEAIDGRDGIQKAEQLKPDLIVLDVSMPGMDGLHAARILKRLMPEVPLLLFSNYGEDPFLKQEARAAGISSIVSKSDSRELIQSIEKTLESPC